MRLYISLEKKSSEKKKKLIYLLVVVGLVNRTRVAINIANMAIASNRSSASNASNKYLFHLLRSKINVFFFKIMIYNNIFDVPFFGWYFLKIVCWCINISRCSRCCNRWWLISNWFKSIGSYHFNSSGWCSTFDL